MHSISAAAGIDGGSYCERWNVVMAEVRERAAHICGSYSISDRTPAICECSDIGRRPLGPIPPLSSCCTGARKPQQAMILGPGGRPSRTATVLHCCCQNSDALTIP